MHLAYVEGGLTPRLTGAGSRRLEGTNISHEDAEGMAYVGVRVEPTVRLGREVEGFHGTLACNLGRCTSRVNPLLLNLEWWQPARYG